MPIFTRAGRSTARRAITWGVSWAISWAIWAFSDGGLTAATISTTWINNAGDNNWNNTTNWTGGVPSGSGFTALFPSGVGFASAASGINIGTGSSLTIGTTTASSVGWLFSGVGSIGRPIMNSNEIPASLPRDCTS